MKQFITLVTFLMLLLFNNCKHEPKPVIRSSNNDTSLKDLVCFNTQILPLITASCAQVGCHDAITQEEGLILNSYDGIINMGTEDLVKYITLTSGKMMPPLPQPRMDIANINLIKKWIAEGAKNSNCIPINCDTSNVLYSNEIAPIINTYCKGCHNTGNKGGNVNLDNFADVKASTLTGKLLFTINASAYTLMPKGGPKLSNCNLRKIQIWADKNCPQ
jgi:hypothetical protein